MILILSGKGWKKDETFAVYTYSREIISPVYRVLSLKTGGSSTMHDTRRRETDAAQ